LSFLAAQWVFGIERKKAESRFEQFAEERVLAIRRGITMNLAVVESLAAFYAGSVFVTRDEFNEFTAPHLRRYIGIQAVEWVPRVSAIDRASYEAKARQEGYPKFTFTELDDNGKVVPAAMREKYFPVFYLEPYKGNEAALGFDLASNPARLEALGQSRDNGEAIATARIRLVQERGEEYGFLYFYPIYKKGEKVETIDERRNHLVGFAVGVFRIGEAVEKLLEHVEVGGVDIYLFDESAPDQESLLYVHASRLRKESEKFMPQARSQITRELYYSDTFDIGGRRWSILCSPIKDLLGPRELWTPWLIFGGGVLFSCLLSAYILMLLRRFEESKSMEIANMKSEFTSMVSHELRTPLAAISESIHLIIEEKFGNVSSEQRELLDISQRNIHRLTRLIDDVLDFQKIEARQLKMHFRETNFNRLIEEVAEYFASEVKLKHLKMELNLVKALPQVNCDPDRMTQVLTNLVSNAIKFSEGGKILLRSEFKDNALKVSVQDHGRGIASEDIPKLFRPFSQLSSEAYYEGKPKGTGLGLTISKKIIEEHHGALSVASVFKKGSTFSFEIPL